MADVKKLSFAKVAASASKETGHMGRATVSAAAPRGERDAQAENCPPQAAPAQALGMSPRADGEASSPAAQIPTTLVADPSPDGQFVQGLKGLKLDVKTPSLVVNGTGSSSTEQSSKAGNSQTPSDEVSQKADSISELGTKPPSLDGKSITSGTTFNVLDEKESLRPDDSASVKAAADEDDAFSIRGSLLANSRMGSDVAGRLRSIQIGDMPPRVIPAHPLPEVHSQGIVTPDSATSGQQPVLNDAVALATASVNTEQFSNFYSQNPDEKLIDAMKSPKDRLFLLRLEKAVIEFVQDSKEPFMDLPPSNSFCRLLTHKLADYYHMTHSFEAVGFVRIYRTPFCRVPPSLGSIAAAANESVNSAATPVVLPRKIMRRGVDGESAPVSAGPSKPTSEAGSELKDRSAIPKEKLTREEREEAYNKARLRIFGSSHTEASTPENEDSTGVSRASSVSAKDKASVGKRGKTGKQRRDDSESFDSRSKYTPYFGHPQYPTWAQQPFSANGNINPQFPPQMPPQPPFQVPGQPVYPPNQAYPPPVANNSYAPTYNGVAKYPPDSASPGRFQPPAPQMPSYGSPVQGTPPQAWQAQTFANQIPQQSPRAPPPPGVNAPYPYGQLPVHPNLRDPKNQHPIPGSYNRHAFNPNSQSFVPASGMPPMPSAAGIPQGPTGPPGPPFAGPGPAHQQQQPQIVMPMVAGPQLSQPQPPASVPLPYNGFPGQLPPPAMMAQPSYAGNGSGYGMMRQDSSSNGMAPFQRMPQAYSAPPPAPLPQAGVLTEPHQLQHPYPHQMQNQHQSQGYAPMHQHQQLGHHHHHHSPRLQNKPVMVASGVSGPVAQAGSSGSAFGNLPNFGNAATLPQKPATT